MESYPSYHTFTTNSRSTRQFPKMRCSNALGHWEQVIEDADNLLDGGECKDKTVLSQVAQLGGIAALNLGNWEKVGKYAQAVAADHIDKNFFMAIDMIQRNRLGEARSCINASREALEAKLGGLLSESYSRAYEKIVKLQQLFEMEEIIGLKEAEEDMRSRYLGSPELYTNAQRDLDKQRKHLKEVWHDRLAGCRENTTVWLKILSVRSILFNKKENFDEWLKFAALCKRFDKLKMCKRVLDLMKAEMHAPAPSQANMVPYPPGLMRLATQAHIMQRHQSVILSAISLNSQSDVTSIGDAVREDVKKKYPALLELASLECDYELETISFEEMQEKMLMLIVDSEAELTIDQRARYLLKLGKSLRKRTDTLNEGSILEISRLFEVSIEYNELNHKSWHAFGLLNYEAVQYFNEHHEKASEACKTKTIEHVNLAVKSFVNAISLGGSLYVNSQQDLLRLLTLWFRFGDVANINQEIRESFKVIDIISWIDVIPQLIARIDIPNRSIQLLIFHLLTFIGKHHPQSLVFQLFLASNSNSAVRRENASKIFNEMKAHSPDLVAQAILISEELNRAALLLQELWYEGMQEAYRLRFSEQDNEAALAIFELLHTLMRGPPSSPSEFAFHQKYSNDLSEAEAWTLRYKLEKNETAWGCAWEHYHAVFRQIEPQVKNLSSLHLRSVAPKLFGLKNSQVAIPGTYAPNKKVVKVVSFGPKLYVFASKQHPRKLSVFGDDEKEYMFLLKGHEDLRQDERAMQLFSLVNNILASEADTERKDLTIITYSVIPLSQNTGLLGWVENCDTLQQIVKEYRETFKIRPLVESELFAKFVGDIGMEVPMANKVEIFRHVLDLTRGEDLQKVLWLQSPNSEIWHDRRTAYMRSLATMSMVGHILGLGDRHPNNLMLQRYKGKIVHIDFGDCFEVAMKRDKYPEKVPFRLTRMLVKAMEACGIEGNFRKTCEVVMKVMRENRESLMALLEAFVYDPLLNWRLLTAQNTQPQAGGPNTSSNPTSSTTSSSDVMKPKDLLNMIGDGFGGGNPFAGAQSLARGKLQSVVTQMSFAAAAAAVGTTLREQRAVVLPDEREPGAAGGQGDEAQIPTEILNQRALEVTDRIRKKLAGRDFKENETLSVEHQVENLINQARSEFNISQAYIGWCPWWQLLS
eukprot:TRINITY_DN7905_c0_g1_i1.p1 TRINITY_DN7905_c0_g1~~TRINITY_DN7905_c0_g1_i1.p1  ORF type:complete len:1154 (+),score=305.78 TRINITY_DN7905_c0_g1_i1:248-3709(+)